MTEETPDTTELATAAPAPIVEAGVRPQGELAQIMATIERMLTKDGIPIATVEAMTAMAERFADRQAKQQFADAMVAFHSECPQIPKRLENKQFTVTRKGVSQPSRYVDMEDADAIVRPILTKYGLSFDWGDALVKDGLMTVAFIVTHRGGHSKTTLATMPTEGRGGGSPCQQFATTQTYCQRYAMFAGLGLTGAYEDADGNDPKETVETITQEEADALNDLLIQLHGEDAEKAKRRMLKYYEVTTLADVPADRLNELTRWVEKGPVTP